MSSPWSSTGDLTWFSLRLVWWSPAHGPVSWLLWTFLHSIPLVYEGWNFMAAWDFIWTLTALYILPGRLHLSTRLIWRAWTGNLGKGNGCPRRNFTSNWPLFSIYSRKPENMAEALQLTESNFILYLFVNLTWVTFIYIYL